MIEKINNLSMSRFKFINCNGRKDLYDIKGTFENVIVGGKEGLLNALLEMRPNAFIRLS